MSKNWGRTPVSNADKRHATQSKYLVVTPDGTEERIDRRPMGKVERFVDPSGNVMSIQLYADGDSRKNESEIRQRSAYHKKGFVEFAKCPLKHGTRHSSTLATKDFAKMPANLATECKHDPKVMERSDGDLYARGACPHIEWLIKARMEKAAKEYAKRNETRAAQEKREVEKRELEAMQLEMAREQLKERKAKKSKAEATE